MNWGQSGRRGLAIDLLLGDHQNPAFSFCSCPDFMLRESYQDGFGVGSGGAILMSAILGTSKRQTLGWHREGFELFYEQKATKMGRLPS